MTYRNQIYVTYAGSKENVQPHYANRFSARLALWNDRHDLKLNFYDLNGALINQQIEARLQKSQAVLLLIYEGMKHDQWLDYEIDLAITKYKLPFIIVYFGRRVVKNAIILSRSCPQALQKHLNPRRAKVGVWHIAYVEEAVVKAVKELSRNFEMKKSDFHQFEVGEYDHWHHSKRFVFNETQLSTVQMSRTGIGVFPKKKRQPWGD